MYILGINGGLRLGYQDVSAVLMKDGQIVGAVEEERIAREKHAPGRLSEKSIVEALRIAGITMQEVDVVATHGATWGDDFEINLKAYLKHRFGHVPKIERHHHHDCHAASAYYASGHESALAFTADGAGDGLSSLDRLESMFRGLGARISKRKARSLLIDVKHPDGVSVEVKLLIREQLKCDTVEFQRRQEDSKGILLA